MTEPERRAKTEEGSFSFKRASQTDEVKLNLKRRAQTDEGGPSLKRESRTDEVRQNVEMRFETDEGDFLYITRKICMYCIY